MRSIVPSSSVSFGLSIFTCTLTPSLCHLQSPGAFFNGVFLLALALSIFLQSIERFIRIEQIDDPVSVLIVGSVGLTLNVLSALVLHGKSLCRT
jgi:zinc transporter 1